MPLTDCFTPAGLSDTAKKVLDSYGGWTGFMQSYGLKPWEDDDAKEGKSILDELARSVEDEEEEEDEKKK